MQHIGRRIARYIDHTALKSTTTTADIQNLCSQAKLHGFAAVCVNPHFVALSKQQLKGSPVGICTVVGFPLGANSSHIKASEAIQAVSLGATQVDMVMNMSAFKSEDYQLVKEDIEMVVKQVQGQALVKVILETCYLSNSQIKHACELVSQTGAHFVKTSTGFGSGGASVEAVRLMRQIVGGKMGVKASGGVKSYSEAIKMIEAGASRIGTSSGVQIMRECGE